MKKAVIKLEVPEYQIGQEVSVYFKDTMKFNGICVEDNPTIEELENQSYVIEKLRKLWIKIYNIEELDNDHEGFYHCQNEALEIINNYISELEGE